MNNLKCFFMVLLINLIAMACSNSNSGSNNEPVGKFAVKQVSAETSKSMMKSITPMDGGEIDASTTQYFILQNIGEAEITNVKMYILSANAGVNPNDETPDTDFINSDGSVNILNFTEITSGFKLNPSTISVLKPYNESDIFQMIAIKISHGTNINGIGLAPLLPKGVNNVYIIVTGESGGTTQQLNIKFSTLVKIAMWQVIYDSTIAGINQVCVYDDVLDAFHMPTDATNVRFKNTGNVALTCGTTIKHNSGPTGIVIGVEGNIQELDPEEVFLMDGTPYSFGTSFLIMVDTHSTQFDRYHYEGENGVVVCGYGLQ